MVAINEQTAYRVPGNSHTSRHAAVELLYCEQTKDCATKEDAIRRLNWATYTVDTDGKNRYPRDDIWLTDGYGDYIRHYLRAMASAPELAPNKETHLLRNSTVIQNIRYERNKVSYAKFDTNSVELIKFGAFNPVRADGGNPTGNAERRVAEIRTHRKEVTIFGK